MARAKKCDRCGALYEISEPNALTKALNNMTHILPNIYDSFKDWKDSHFDFCPGCSHSLNSWFFKPSLLAEQSRQDEAEEEQQNAD